MARPLDIRFFEVPLPENLPPEREWLHLYHANSEKLVEYMASHGAKTSVSHMTLRCVTVLRTFLIENGTEYTPETSFLWLDLGKFTERGGRMTLLRLSDLYQFGSVQPIHAFPIAKPYYRMLSETWKHLLDDFITSIVQSKKTADQIRIYIARFLFQMQQQGIQTPEEISFDLLDRYLQEDIHKSHNLAAKYTYSIGDFILFLADNGMCKHGLGWYPYFWMHNRIPYLSNMTDAQIKIVEEARSESMDFPAEEFAVIIPDFLMRFQELGYRKTPCNVAKFTLHNLLLFLEMNGLGYHPAIAAVWLENEKCQHNSSGWKQHRRILNLFEAYTAAGDIMPQHIFREKPLLCEGLPDWCREELDAFMALKRREGWAESTLTMYRSSITRFCFYILEQGLTAYSEIIAETLSAFNRSDKHHTAEGKNAYNVRIRHFLQFLERKQLIPFGLHKALLCAAAPSENIVVTLTEQEKAVINTHNACSDAMQLRNRAILLLGMKMGIRASDIVGIEISDINWDKQSIKFIQQKTSHEVNLPMPTAVGNAIYRYITEGRPTTECRSLFVKHRVPYNSLNREACLRALKATLPNRHVSHSGFHVTRKTFASDQLKKGVERQTISELLGHRGTSSLNPYLSMDEKRMRMCSLSLETANLCMGENRYGI